MANHLYKEKSPYLLQHKDNPVNWYPWCKEAFEAAAAEDKPIFLSIGYSTCHWCHVMAHESFEDPQIARLLDAFICIKVDREERPDIDAVYMQVCQALTGSGGWPLSIFMTPEQKPFFAGTYFPKTSRYGQPGFSELLQQMTLLWQTKRDRLLTSGNEITRIIQNNEFTGAGRPDKILLKKGFQALQQNFDADWGGFGSAPKFPCPHHLLFLMTLFQREKIPQALHMTEVTLTAMAAGGIFDSIGGGFSRYATDEKWLVPHFEKMLYDNALLLLAYLEGFQLTGKQSYADTARRTADYILQELTDPDGGFYCGQDADSGGIEGKYYLLTPQEVLSVLGEESGKEFCRLYNITAEGNFEGQSIPNRIGLSGSGWSYHDPRLAKLRAFRKTRTSLHLDRKILLSWNAWTILAFAKAGNILKEPSYLNAALHAQEFIQTHMTYEGNRLYHRFCDGEAACRGQLEDYAVYALALIELYTRTLHIKYLREALSWAGQMREQFEDKEHGGYYMTAHDAETLIARPKETYDGAVPSGNSVAAMVLEYLAGLTGTPFWREAADRQQRFMAGAVKEYPSGHSFALLAMAQVLYPPRELLCAGNRFPHEIPAYLQTHPAHDIRILYKSPDNEKELSKLAPFTHSYPLSEDIRWYLCENGTCRPPASDFSALNL